MPKFFVDDTCIFENKICIVGDDVNHIKNVLRLKPGNNIIVSNGKDKEFEVKITGIRDKVVETEIIRQIYQNVEPSIDITLIQGLPKSDKLELIIQKAVEIGVKKIIPIITERVIVKLDKEKLQPKVERWQKIAEQAAKQSGRNIIPEVSKPVNYKEFLKIIQNYELAILLYEKELKLTLRKVLMEIESKPKSVAIFVGPEGGFSEKEIELAKQYHIQLVSLGPRILRTETAGLVSAGIVLYQFGELG